MHEIRVSVVSTEEAFAGTAEFWSGGELIALTHYQDSDLMLRIELETMPLQRLPVTV